ncbi:sentrin-specific protease 1-like [Olea europaea subsp. europaea]|uniref:Sentrin-specific protease 1-like n=1 Tax=Olea europaea subsp. europaea TaxID=158383 RepID=A0A8S0PSY1_OLEEU|nr:sentrin-specific protease 1-like [Olea europaea subsp. europaea]
MPDLDLVEALQDNDVAMFGVLYFLTAYLFPRDYKKAVNHFLFVLIEDFNKMNSFPWGKLLFQITLGVLRDGLSRRTPRYRLRGMLVAFQAWIYETFPYLDGIVVTRISRVHPLIVNWMADEQPSAVKLKGPDCFSNPKIEICDLKPLESEIVMPYMNGVQYNKPIQLTSSTESRRRTKHRTERSIEDVDTSEKLGPSVLPLMDSNIGQAHYSDDDDDFVASPPRRQSHPPVENPWLLKVLQPLIILKRSHNLMGAQRDDFLSESMSIMISSAMNEIIRRSADKTSERGVGQKEAPGVGDQEHHGAGGFEKAQEVENVVSNVDRKGKGKMDPSDDLLFSLEPTSFDLGIEFTPPNVLHSEETQKRADSIIFDVVTTTKTVENEGSPIVEPISELPVKWILRPSRVLQSAFVAGQERGKLFKHDDNVVVFEDYKDNVDEVNKSSFMGWFQRGKKFSEEDDAIKPAFLIGSFPVGHKTWFHELINSESSLRRAVLQGQPYMKVLPALMNTLGISKKDPDYHEPKAKKLKVIIDDTLPQQTNGQDCGIFLVLYALYFIRGGGCSILEKFDTSKFRMDIATLLYKHR